MNFIAYSDGKNDLQTIAKYIEKNYSTAKKIYKILKIKKLVE